MTICQYLDNSAPNLQQKEDLEKVQIINMKYGLWR